MKRILTVSELTANIKILLETSFGVLWITGEVSNLRRPASGHCYMTLKDTDSQVRAVLFRQTAASVGFELEDGMEIVCRCRLSVYQPRGEYQIVIDTAEPRGLGALQKAFEQLKERLEKEGLFDPSRKKPIPFLPRQIAVVTSPTGAAIRDILTVAKRRFPGIPIVIVPVRVQGVDAAEEIAEAIATVNAIADSDVIITGRGGGSLEDLFPFNDERVARAIYASAIPVVSAVGHEIDFTISDFVADMRAPTPSAAAEMVVPNRAELRGRVDGLAARLVQVERNRRTRRAERLRDECARFRDPRRVIEDQRMACDEQVMHMTSILRTRISLKRARFARLSDAAFAVNPAARVREARICLENVRRSMVAHITFNQRRMRDRLQQFAAVLETVSPLAILKRGYAIVTALPDGAVMKDVHGLSRDDSVLIRVSRGRFTARVTAVTEEEDNGGEKV